MSKQSGATPNEQLTWEFRIPAHIERHGKIYFTALVLLCYGVTGYMENM